MVLLHCKSSLLCRSLICTNIVQNLPFGGLSFLIILLILDLHTPKTPLRQGLKAVDWAGAITMVGGTIMLLLGLELGGVTFPWDSATVICLIVFGVIVIGLFFFVEHRFAPYPLMPLDLFSKRSNMAALGVCFCHSYVFIPGSYFLPLYFQAVLGATPILSGVYLLPTALSLSFLSTFTGVFIKKTGQYLPPIWFGLFFMTLGTGLFINLGANSSWAKIILYQIIAGIGVGPNFQSPLIALQSLVPVSLPCFLVFASSAPTAGTMLYHIPTLARALTNSTTRRPHLNSPYLDIQC